MILLLVFCGAVAGILFFMNREDETEVSYAASGPASLPVVYMEVEGEQVNGLHGYRTAMQAQYIRDTVTPLPADRQLQITIEDVQDEIINIEYEIRSLDTQRLVEDTQLTGWDSQEGSVTAVLPIQNLLEADREYLLTLILSTREDSEIYYYTRVTLADVFHTAEMIDFIREFHDKTFDPDQSEDLVVYMRQTTADRNTLANVSLRSTFSQLTWGDLEPVPVTEPRLDIKDLNATIGSFTLSYQVQAANPDREGETDTYDIEEFYCVQWSSSQWYVLSFERTMNQIFVPSGEVITDSAIDLGILEDTAVQAVRSNNGSQTVFSVSGELWSYAAQSGELTRIFSFEKEGEEDIRNRLKEHEIQIVEAADNGDVHFIVYGYMNNGAHEGEVGMAFYVYRKDSNDLTEVFYLPCTEPYQILREEVGILSYLSDSGLFYLMFDDSIYAIDFAGDEFVVVVDQVQEEGMAISADSSVIAWQEGQDADHGEVIHVMDLETSAQYTIEAEEGEYVKALGFIENDFICGVARQADVESGDASVPFPMYAVEIYGQSAEPETRYERDGIYISGISVEPGSVKLYRVERGTGGTWREISEDALIQNTSRDEEEEQVLVQNNSESRRNVYVISLATGNTAASTGLAVTDPRGILTGSSNTITLGDENSQEDVFYYAYAKGKLQQICATAAEAIQLTYDDIGTVVFGDGNYVLRRGYRDSSVSIDMPAITANSEADSLASCLEILLNLADGSADVEGQLEEGTEPAEILRGALPGNAHDLTGCSLEQIMYYYLSFGYPLIVRTAGQSYQLITGYNYSDISLYDPVTGEETSMDIDTAAEYFESCGNEFIGYLP